MHSTVNRARERRSCGMKRETSPRVSNNFTTRNARAIRQRGNRFCSIAQTAVRTRVRLDMLLLILLLVFLVSSSRFNLLLLPHTPYPPPLPFAPWCRCIHAFAYTSLRHNAQTDPSGEKENAALTSVSNAKDVPQISHILRMFMQKEPRRVRACCPPR